MRPQEEEWEGEDAHGRNARDIAVSGESEEVEGDGRTNSSLKKNNWNMT